ncbi:4037_t:CDS:2, partial [Gigaspora rosea]
PRLDYVVWIICTRLLPDQLVRLHQMCHRRITPSWFDDFKRDWNRLAATPIDDDDHTCYFIDSARWICSCLSFLNSCFLICKHLVKRATVIAKLQNIQEVNTQKSMAFQIESDNNIIEIDEVPFDAIRHMADHLEQELAANNFNYIICVTNNMDRLFTMLNDIETAQNRRRRNQTW